MSELFPFLSDRSYSLIYVLQQFLWGWKHLRTYITKKRHGSVEILTGEPAAKVYGTWNGETYTHCPGNRSASERQIEISKRTLFALISKNLKCAKRESIMTIHSFHRNLQLFSSKKVISYIHATIYFSWEPLHGKYTSMSKFFILKSPFFPSLRNIFFYQFLSKLRYTFLNNDFFKR